MTEPPAGDATLADRLATAFALGRPVAMTRRARGALGAVWELRTRAGGRDRVTAVKELFAEEPTPEQAEREVAFAAACRAAGVPSPAPVRSVGGGLLVDLDGVTWRGYEWVPGVPADWEDGPTLLWLGRQAATLHRVGAPAPVGEDARWYSRVDHDWGALVGGYRAAGLPHAGRVAERLDDLVATSAFVDSVEDGPALWCHRDLNATNVLVSGAGRVLVDWDNAGPLDPVRDLASVFMHVLGDHDLLPRIHDGYVAAGGPARVTGPESLVTGAAIYLNFLAGEMRALLRDAATGCDDPSDPAGHRAFAVHAVGAVVESVPTVRDLEAAARAILRG